MITHGPKAGEYKVMLIQIDLKWVNHVTIKQPTPHGPDKWRNAIQQYSVQRWTKSIIWPGAEKAQSEWTTEACARMGREIWDKSIEPKDPAERKQSSLHRSNRYQGWTIHIESKKQMGNPEETCLRDTNDASAVAGPDSGNVPS